MTFSMQNVSVYGLIGQNRARSVKKIRSRAVIKSSTRTRCVSPQHPPAVNQARVYLRSVISTVTLLLNHTEPSP